MRGLQRTGMTVAALTALLLLSSAGATLALDINPPEWRGLPGTTWQGWEFNVNDTMPPADIGDNRYGNPIAFVNPIDPGWIADLDGMQGVWPLSGEIYAEVPNTPFDPLHEKWIRVQLTWQLEPDAVNPPLVEVVGTTPEIPGVPAQAVPVQEIQVGVGDWLHTTYEITLPENPEMETIRIAGDIYVDELVIDTYCVPEPSSALLAAMSLVAVVGMTVRRRRR